MTEKPTKKDVAEIRAELQGMLDQAQCSWLAPFAKRDSVIMVAPELDLVEVGMKVVLDDKTAVGGWLEKGLLKRPDPAQLKSWEADTQRTFMVLVVQPYVLAQERVYH